MADGRVALAADAFIYGFPLVFDLQEVDRFAPRGDRGGAGRTLQRFGHAPRWPVRRTRSCRINNDTVYSIAQVDIERWAGPSGRP